jgi:branched-chain amino acid transport system ATP-binding protein
MLLLDEPSLGLAAPLVVEPMGQIRQLSENIGTTVAVVEQKVREVLKISDHVYVLRNGRVSFSGPSP